jgi:uncharacterized protein
MMRSTTRPSEQAAAPSGHTAAPVPAPSAEERRGDSQAHGAVAGEAACCVEVVYALPDEQRIVSVTMALGATAEDAVRVSGILEAFPDIAARPLVLGRFGERIEVDHVLSHGDRIEICRPLVRDPRTLRRELLAQGRVMGVAAKRNG